MDQVDAFIVDQPAQRALFGQLPGQRWQAAAERNRQCAGNAFIGHGPQQAAVGRRGDVERVLAVQRTRQRDDVRGVAATVAVVEVGVQDFHGGSSGNAHAV